MARQDQNMLANMRFGERAISLFSPKIGAAIYNERMKEESAGASGQIETDHQMASTTGYGNHGANRTKTSMLGWASNGGSAEDDIDLNGSELRQRARDLYAGGGIGRSAVATLTTFVVGPGMTPKPQIDGEALGMSPEACQEWNRLAKREFMLWADDVFCDAQRQLNFWAMQELALRSMLMSGDVFAIFGEKENPQTPYLLTLKMIEADRVSTPQSSGESEAKKLDSGGRIVDGVEVDKEGCVVRYHISNYHPLAGDMPGQQEWVTIDAFAKDTGMRNILHILTVERPEQRRGTPLVSAVIEKIKNLDRYNDSELAANIVAAMLTAFITSDLDDGKFGLESAVSDDERVSDDDYHIELAPGAVYDLPPGKKISTVDPRKSNGTYPDFTKAQRTDIGSSLEIPEEVLMHKYDANYTASRGARLDFAAVVDRFRKRFNDMFSQPVYDAWLAEAVALGRIDAPGFFDDPLIRKAYCKVNWMGPSMGHMNPVQEANAAAIRINNNLSTQEQEAAEYSGGEWDDIVEQRRKEVAVMYELAKAMQPEKPATKKTKEETEE